MSQKIRVTIVGGGFSNERKISLLTAQQIAMTLPKEKFDVSLIEITPEKTWLLRNDIKQLETETAGNEIIALDPKNSSLKEGIDVVFIALHGKFGEDGRIQAIFDLLEIPYTGSGVMASALGMNKIKCLEILNSYGILIPKFLAINKKMESTKELDELIAASFGYPCVIKPNESGSSIGISIVHNKDGLKQALDAAFNEDRIVIAQEFIKGRELACAVLGNSLDTDISALPPVEIIAHGSEFFDYQAKYFSKQTEEICPAPISEEITSQIKDLSIKIHKILGCDGLSRSDFILQNGQLYFLEINTIPGQTQASLSPKAALAAGISFEEFVLRQIDLAIKKFKK